MEHLPVNLKSVTPDEIFQIQQKLLVLYEIMLYVLTVAAPHCALNRKELEHKVDKCHPSVVSPAPLP